MNWFLFYNLLFAHIIADFYLQGDDFCTKKRNGFLKSPYLYIHAGVVFVLSAIVSWDVKFILPAGIIAVSHLAIDCIKCWVERRMRKKSEKIYQRFGIYVFIADQLLHISIIAIVVHYFCPSDWEQFAYLSGIEMKAILVTLAALLLAKPANVVVKILFKKFTITDGEKQIPSSDDNENSVFHSGRLIGTLERWLILIFVLLSQYEAIGFLVAAKSILRFKETQEEKKSEYILVGTLISIFLALGTGIVVILLE